MLVDIGYAFNERISGLLDLVRALSSMDAGTMASTIKQNEKMIERYLEKTNEYFRELNAMEYGTETAESAE